MNCSVCGAAIPDGQNVCPACGNPVATQGPVQPVSPMGQQPMGGYQQPMNGQPMGGYQQPMNGQPMGGYQQPMNGQPMGGYQQPMNGQPMGGYQQPMGGYQQPMNGQPMGGYQQPMGGYQQPMNGQPMGGYQQPNQGFNGSAFNFNGFSDSIKGQAGSMKLLALIGGAFITISPFFNWLSVKMKYDGDKEKETCNLFKLAGEKGMDNAIFAVAAIFIIICGVALIAEALKDNIPAVQSLLYKNNYMQYIGIGLVAIVLIFWLIAFFNGDLKDGIEMSKDMIKWAKKYSDDVSGHANHGFGPILCMLGIIASAFPRVMALLKKSN